MILASPERIAEYTARGWWGTTTLDQGFRAIVARHPQREAVVDAPNREALTDGAPRRLSYAQLEAEVARMAAAGWRPTRAAVTTARAPVSPRMWSSSCSRYCTGTGETMSPSRRQAR